MNNQELKELFIKNVENLDFNINDVDDLIEQLPNCYAKGYLAATQSFLSEQMATDTEHYRTKILECSSWDIWIS